MSLTITHTQADGHVHIDVALPPKPPVAEEQSVHQRSPSTHLSALSQSPIPSRNSYTGAVVKSYGPLNGHRSVSSSSSLTEKSLPLVQLNGDPHNTLDSVRKRVAQGVAWRAISHAQTIDGIKVGVALTLATASSPKDAEMSLGHVVRALRTSLKLHQYLFAVASAGPHAYRSASNAMSRSSSYSGSVARGSKRSGRSRAEPPRWPLVLVGSSAQLVEKAATLACAKFLGRLREVRAEGGDRWLGYIEDTYLSDEGIDGSWGADEAMIWDIVRKVSCIRSLHIMCLNSLTPDITRTQSQDASPRCAIVCPAGGIRSHSPRATHTGTSVVGTTFPDIYIARRPRRHPALLSTSIAWRST